MNTLKEDIINSKEGNITKDEEEKYTPTSVYEIKLLNNNQQEKSLLKYSDCARQHYNAVLGEALKRLKLVKNDPLYKETVKLSKTDKKEKQQRTDNFKFLNKKYGFTKNDLEKWGTKSKNDSKFIGKHVGTHVLQKLSNNAFRAVQKVAFGKAKKVRFYKKGEFITMEGKNNETYIMYSNGYAIIGKETIKCKVRKNDKHYEHMLKHRIKFCKLIMKRIKNKNVFYLQISYEGYPYKKIAMGNKTTGLDIGPSTIAIVNEDETELLKFCEDIPNLDKKINKMKRINSRKLRLLNPQNYDEKGAVKKGSKVWNKSNSYKKLQDKIRYEQYRLSEMRKCEHGKLANNIVTKSNIVKSEKLSYKAFQKLFGRSVGKTAPSMFINKLKDKLKLYGGEFIDINTYSTKLSQTCICGNVEKKSLSQRYHTCNCGVSMQRDIYSAYLAIFINKDGKKLNIKKAKNNYEDYKPSMDRCVEKLKAIKKTNPKRISSSFGI